MGGDGPLARRPQEVLDAVPVHVDVGCALGSAVCAAGAATPFIMTVDKGVTLAAAGNMSLGKALIAGFKDIFFKPHVVLRHPAIWMVAGVYGATYTCANTIDLVAERKDVSATAHQSTKLLATTGVNMSASIAKDVAFAKMFGKVEDAAKSAKKSVPLATFGLFFGRDVLTIGAGFILPPVVSTAIASSSGMEKKDSDKVAQLVTPMGMQLICTPIHLFALNMYNEPVATLSERIQGVWRTCPESTAIRMIRFLFAYGFGGIANKELIKSGKEWSEATYAHGKKVE